MQGSRAPLHYEPGCLDEHGSAQVTPRGTGPARSTLRPQLQCCTASYTFSAWRLQRGWRVQGGKVTFDPEQMKATRDLPAKELISNALTYARELERIV